MNKGVCEAEKERETSFSYIINQVYELSSTVDSIRNLLAKKLEPLCIPEKPTENCTVKASMVARPELPPYLVNLNDELDNISNYLYHMRTILDRLDI